MSRFYLKFAFLSFLVFNAIMLLIRAQPYDDREMRALLMPDNCEMPCFMGIRPGVTTMDEAVKLLKVSGWVNEATLMEDARSIVWAWGENAPRLLDPKSPMFISRGGSITSLNNVVQTINFSANLNIGEILLYWGKPSAYGISHDMIVSSSSSPSYPYTKMFAYPYDKQQTIIVGLVFCPSVKNFWQTPVRAQIGSSSTDMRPHMDIFANPIKYSTSLDMRDFFMHISASCKR